VIGADHLATMARIGATTVVCLVEEHELSDRYPAYVAWLRANCDGPAIWFPIHDLHAPTLATMRPLLDDLAQRVRRGETVLVHCAAGIGRAGTTAVSILLLLGMDLTDARVHVARHRAMAGPEAGAQRVLVQELADALSAERGDG
jgi:protein-tyrosine phosphatase